MDAAVDHFRDLDPARHGAIAHISGDPEALQTWFSALGPRTAHLHLQARDPQSAPSTPRGKETLRAAFAVLRDHDFQGTMSLEFTRGIGRDEQIEEIYANACTDLSVMRYLCA